MNNSETKQPGPDAASMDPMTSTAYLAHLEDVAKEDVKGLIKAQESYGNSWKKRGGVGAFMMLARKWDRMENRVRGEVVSLDTLVAHPCDIFEHIAVDKRAEGLIDDIRDLRRYLLLVEAEMRARGAKGAVSTHRDNHDCEPFNNVGPEHGTAGFRSPPLADATDAKKPAGGAP